MMCFAVLFCQVKLADMLSKLIVPVSFIDQWPPKVLAMQFATIQYIPWRVDPTPIAGKQYNNS